MNFLFFENSDEPRRSGGYVPCDNTETKKEKEERIRSILKIYKLEKKEKTILSEIIESICDVERHRDPNKILEAYRGMFSSFVTILKETQRELNVNINMLEPFEAGKNAYVLRTILSGIKNAHN